MTGGALRHLTLSAGALVLGGALVAAVAWLASQQRQPTARCPEGLRPSGPRCCAPGQTQQAGRCTGSPESCPHPMRRTTAGCLLPPAILRLEGGTLELGPSDWEAEGRVEPARLEVGAFRLDRAEVTVARWQLCVQAGICPRLDGLQVAEPGRPITGVPPDAAAGFCRFAKGRLPSGDEWLFAAMGTEGRRFPWGSTGLVCRRAAYGLSRGPCAEGATGPELAGARPDGASPEGVLDLVGNVAEWTREDDGKYAARGGSYRSRVAAKLKSWSSRPTSEAAPDIGFRCAYAARNR